VKFTLKLAVTAAAILASGAVAAGASGTATPDEEADLALLMVNRGDGACARNATCVKLNRHALASNLLVRQLLVQNGVAMPPVQ
jgi:hypothetical protein